MQHKFAKLYARALDGLAARSGNDWQIVDRHVPGMTWRVFNPPGARLPSQGWKIHVSAAAVEMIALCDVVGAVLVERRITFKLPATAAGVVAINSGRGGDTQIGKILTLFPRDDDEAASIAMEIDRLWPSTRGPVIPSDRALRKGGAVFLRYGAFGGGPVLFDDAGRHELALRRPDGTLVPDQRNPLGIQPSWAPDPPVPCVAPEAPDIAARIAMGDREYLPLELLHAAPKGKVLLCMSLDDATTSIMKVVNRGVGGDLNGCDARDRLLNEYAVLSELTKHAGVCPRPLGLHDGDSCVLLMEDVEGIPLGQLSAPERIRSLPLLADALARLHALGFVHGDVKLANAILSDDRVRLLDFELAAASGTERPFVGGTQGYMPPEGPSAEACTTADVYALGACVFHALTGCDPAVLPCGPGRLIGALHLSSQHRAARLVCDLRRESPTRRPSAAEAARRLRGHARSFESCGESFRLGVKLGDTRWAARAAWEAALSTRRFVRSDPDGMHWQSAHPAANSSGEGLNIGAAGIVLGLISIEQALGRQGFERDIAGAAGWLAARPAKPGPPGLFTGNAGVALALALVSRRLGLPEVLRAARRRLDAAVHVSEECDLFAGAAGVLWAGCTMAEMLGEAWPLEAVREIGSSLLARARREEGIVYWQPSGALDGSTAGYTGAAHGSAGIAMALARWGQADANARAVDLAVETFRSLYAHARLDDGVQLRDRLGPSPRAGDVRSWCHGVAGYLWAILTGLGDDPRLREEIDWATGVFASAALVGNPTYCHGIAGHLELWRMLRAIPRHHDLAERRATLAAAMLRMSIVRSEHDLVWCSEEPHIVTPDLWVGLLGPASALALFAAERDASLLSSSWLRHCTVSTP